MSQTPRSVISLPWRLLLLAGTAALGAGVVGVLTAQEPGWIRFFDNLHWTAGTLMGAVLSWFGVRAAPAESRRGLRWIAIGLSAYAFGQLVWDLQSELGHQALASPADLFYLWLGPCITAGLLFESFRLTDRGQRTTLLLDAAILAITGLTLVLVLYLPQHSTLPLPTLALLAAYPVTLFTAASVGLIAAPTLRLKRNGAYWLFLLSLIVTSVSWMVWNMMVLEGRPVEGARINSLFSVSVVGMGLATLFWRFEPSQNAVWDRISESILRLLPLTAVVASSLAVILLLSQGGVPPLVRTIANTGALVVVGLAMLKQSMVLREHELLKTLSRHLEESERQKYLILNTMPDLVWLKDANGAYQMCNPGFERLYGAPESAIVGKTDFDFVDPQLARFFLQKDQEAMQAGHALRNEEWVTFAHDGREVLLETVKTPLRDRQGTLLGVLGIARDITERERASRQLALVDFALNHVKEAAFLMDEGGRLHYVNDEACRSLGYAREQLLQLRVIDIDQDCASPEQWQTTWAQLKLQRTMTFESTHRAQDGSQFPVEVNANYFEFGGQPYVLSLARDIVERKQAEEQIWNLAYFDALTKLPNRRLLMDRLGHALASSQRSRAFGALLILDLDHFKTLNDTQGHDVGDRLLIEVSQRLTACVRREDTVCRLGGDEFVVLLEGLGQDERHAAHQAELVAEKVRLTLGQPYLLNPNEAEFHGSASIGVTLFSDQKLPVEALLKQADVALYQAKDAGRDQIRFFNPAMQAAIDARTVLEAALRRALDQDELRLYYQPQVDQRDRLVGAEVLLRWHRLDQAWVSPADFIPLAEDTGLILSIGQWVLDTACAQLKAWSADPRTRNLQLSVNVSARQFLQENFVDAVRHSLKTSGIDPARLKLELTESVVLDDIDGVVSRMQELIALGVSFCLDDFGTGYSSLSYLKRLPLEQVKIDQSFVRDVTEDQNDAAIVRAIMAMSRSLGLQVVAEGVETQAQRDFLLQNDCTIYQGFLFCEPVPIEEWQRCLDAFGDPVA